MALVTRYFGPTAAGAGDGTTFADRAALFSGGAWSPVITGFSFAGTDSLECRVCAGMGNYTITATLTGLAPTSTNRLLFCGADSSGNRLAVPNPGWTADQPAFDVSSLPVLSASANQILINAFAILRLLRFVLTGTTTASPVPSAREINWCAFEIGGAGGASFPGIGGATCRNSMITATLPIYSQLATFSGQVRNNRIIGPAGTSGTRAGFRIASTNSSVRIIQNCISGVGGVGIYLGATHTGGTTSEISENTVLGCGSHGIHIEQGTPPTSGTGGYSVSGNYIANCGGNGLIAVTDHLATSDNRIRDCALGATSGLQVEFETNTAAGTDADELANAAGGDYRIKAGSNIHGKGYGVSDQPPATGGTGGGLPGSRLFLGF